MITEPIRILQVFGRLDRGGAEGVIMNLYRKFDRTKIQFDFVVHTDKKCAYDDEIVKLGGRIYRVPQFKGINIFSYFKAWNKFFNEHKEYKIIHSHVSSTAIIYLLLAKSKGLTTIIHSHSTSSGKGFQALVKDILQVPLRFICDYYIACSHDAGNWLFGKRVTKSEKFYLLKNAIDMNEFNFNEDSRSKIRYELNISENKKVIIHVGNFCYPKNHEFLIDIFSSLLKENDSYILLLVGDGELRQPIEEKVTSILIQDKVKFLGVREDVSELLSASDLFLFPSHFEGLGLVLIEAQASSLPCLISDTIPKEVIVTDIVQALSLSDSLESWREKAEQLLSMNHDRQPRSNDKLNQYDINKTSKWLSDFYMTLTKERY